MTPEPAAAVDPAAVLRLLWPFIREQGFPQGTIPASVLARVQAIVAGQPIQYRKGVAQFILQVAEMRREQKTFYDGGDLTHAKRALAAESRVDRWLELIENNRGQTAVEPGVIGFARGMELGREEQLGNSETVRLEGQ